MLLRQLEIWNYRGIKHTTLRLGRHTLLVGPNNVGKSTVLQAVNCLFGREGTRPTEIDIYDFHDADVLASRTPDALTCAPGVPQPPDSGDGTPLDPRFRPGFIHIEGLLTLSPSEVRNLKHLDGPVIRYYRDGEEADEPRTGCEPCCRIAFRARLKTCQEIEDALDDSPFIVKRYFPRPLDQTSGEPLDLTPDEVRTPFLNRVGFYFLPSSRHWQTALHLDRSIMGRLLRHQSVFPVLDSWEKLSASVLKETTKIERESQPFSEVLARVRDHLARLVGVEGDLGYELSDLSFDGLEQALVPFLRQEGCRPLPLRIQGSGVVSLQLFALILEFIQGREAKGLSSLLLIEEPELHLFPFNQRRLLEAVMTAPISESAPPDPSAPATPDVVAPSPDAGLQLIVTSHSPTVAEQFDLDSILILTKSLNDEVQAKALRPDEARPEKWFRREKTAIVSALMSRAVLVVEGQGEERMLNILGSSHLHPRGLAALGVGVLNGEGAQICNTAEWIAETGTNVITLVDGDANGCQYAEDLRRRQISFLSWPPSWKLGHAVLHNATEPLRRKLWDEARRAASKRHQMPEDPRDIPAAFDELIKAQAAADAVAWRLIEEPWLPPAFGALFDTLNAKLRDAQSQERVPFFGETLTVPGV